MFSDFDINLAHGLGFGDEYEIWRFDDINLRRDARVRVSKHTQYILRTNKNTKELLISIERFNEYIKNNQLYGLFTSQARHLVQMWHSKQGDNATPVTMIEALERMSLTRAIIEKIKQEFSID